MTIRKPLPDEAESEVSPSEKTIGRENARRGGTALEAAYQLILWLVPAVKTTTQRLARRAARVPL